MIVWYGLVISFIASDEIIGIPASFSKIYSKTHCPNFDLVYTT